MVNLYLDSITLVTLPKYNFLIFCSCSTCSFWIPGCLESVLKAKFMSRSYGRDWTKPVCHFWVPLIKSNSAVPFVPLLAGCAEGATCVCDLLLIFSRAPRSSHLESFLYLPKPAPLIPPGVPPPPRHLCLLRASSSSSDRGHLSERISAICKSSSRATGIIPLCVLKGSSVCVGVCLRVCALSRTLPVYYQRLVLIGAEPGDRKII